MCYLKSVWNFVNHIIYVYFVIFFIAVVIEEPEFTEVIENVTVPAGRNVKLACSVKNLGSYKVSLNIFLKWFIAGGLSITKNILIPNLNQLHLKTTQ